MPKISPQTQKLISRYQAWHAKQKPKEGVSTIHVDEVASKVAAFYEKIREIVDWKEEHLMRKAAVERVLKRRIFVQEEKEGLAQSLILELIRAGHFPNDRIEEQKIGEIQKIIDKYLFILEKAPAPPPKLAKKSLFKSQMASWLLELAACEIEETLCPSHREKALIEYMEEIMKKRIQLKKPIPENEKNTQIYIAVQRALFNLDAPLITYHLLKRKYHNWKEPNLATLQEIASRIYLLWEEMEKCLCHPLADKFYQICEKYDTPYLLLHDILSQNPSNAEKQIAQPAVLESLIKTAYEKRLRTLKVRLRRAAVYATLSIFLTKILALWALEVPFIKYIHHGQLNSLTMAVGILGPTLLMAVLITTTPLPSRENVLQAVMEVMKIVYQKEQKDIYEIKPSPRRGFVLGAIINFFYLVSCGLSVGLIIWGLSFLHISLFSSIIFIVFLSLIAFAGTKIRERAKELEILDRKEGLWHILIDPLAIPIVHLGKWLSYRWQKYNIISAFFNFLVDLPFVVFIEFLEQWRYFLKEKKEEIH